MQRPQRPQGLPDHTDVLRTHPSPDRMIRTHELLQRHIARPRRNEAQNWEHRMSCCHANLHLTLSGAFLSTDSSSDVRTTLCLCLEVQGCTCVLSLGMGAWSPTCGSWCQWNNEVSFTYGRLRPQAVSVGSCHVPTIPVSGGGCYLLMLNSVFNPALALKRKGRRPWE